MEHEDNKALEISNGKIDFIFLIFFPPIYIWNVSVNLIYKKRLFLLVNHKELILIDLLIYNQIFIPSIGA